VARGLHKNPPLVGFFSTKEENSLDSALHGWRCSADHSCLPANSLLTGNFAYLARERLNPMREASIFQQLPEQFPAKTIREYFISNKELPIDIKEFFLPSRKRPFSALLLDR
jgi:hypothetical protein